MKCINKALLNTLNSRDLLITLVALIFLGAAPWACPVSEALVVLQWGRAHVCAVLAPRLGFHLNAPEGNM